MSTRVDYPPPVFVFGDPCPPAYLCATHQSWRCSTRGPSRCYEELTDCIQDVLASLPEEDR